ncbi:hypothetical protein CSC2_23280 [Clostridium zeae]|uniref:Transpeptidase-transglycosylase n=1 Tax=Clostridium zeae TaxID=2759022 RepID=A0ABQ1EAI4_9CLOT|nr:hypothetical protein [Clostridium zeae]GFZ31802.1 hypothetical protein CSC2_23280 [Clostridium zeae]
MNIFKKKIIFIPIAIILYLILYSTSPQIAGVVSVVGTLVWGGYLYIKNEKFKARGKIFKTITTIGMVLFFITFGIGGLTYDPAKSEQTGLTSQKVIAEQQVDKAREEKAKEEQKVKEDKAKREAEELAKADAQKKAEEEQAQVDAKKKAEEEQAQADAKKKAEEESKQKEQAAQVNVKSSNSSTTGTTSNSSSSNTSSKSVSTNNSASQSSNSDKQTITVFTTNTGHKYHRDGCKYLSKSKIPISLNDAKASGLDPCSVCNPPQ